MDIQSICVGGFLHGQKLDLQGRRRGETVQVPVPPKVEDLDWNDPGDIEDIKCETYRLCFINNQNDEHVSFWVPNDVPDGRIYHYLIKMAVTA